MSPYDLERHEWEDPALTVAAHTSSPPVDWGNVDRIVIHYPATTRIDPDESMVDHLRADHRWYVQDRGYSYGYNAVVWDGVAAEVRGETFRNAANKPDNGSTFSIQVRVVGQSPDKNGNDTSTPASDADIVAVHRLVRWCEERAGRTLEIVGHRDVRSTGCPGDAMYAQVLAGVFRPPAPTPPEPDMPIRLFKFDNDPPLFASADGITAVWVSLKQWRKWNALGLVDPSNIEMLDRAEAVRFTFVGRPPDGYTGIWAESSRF